MKSTRYSMLMVCAALGVIWRSKPRRAAAADTPTSQRNDAQSNTASEEDFPVVMPVTVSNQGTRIVVQAYALKRLYDTMVISYYDQVGGLQGQDEYGYGTHDIDTLLSVKEVKSYVLPTKLIIVGIKDENGDMIVTKATNL
ncbi:hypothetical protein [Aeromonas sp. s5]|uniref:hypothetical protein n=1 Tax=Aeromonas sp. s5 TaxID=3138487 RepID=UPI0034A5AED7